MTPVKILHRNLIRFGLVAGMSLLVTTYARLAYCDSSAGIGLGGGYPLPVGEGKGGNRFEGKGSVYFELTALVPHRGDRRPEFEFTWDTGWIMANNVVADSRIDALFVHHLVGFGYFIPLVKVHTLELKGMIGGHGMWLQGVSGGEAGFTFGAGLAYTVPLISPDHDLEDGCDLLFSARVEYFNEMTQNIGNANIFVPGLALVLLL